MIPALSLAERSIQDKHGEVCPAGWSEGGKTIKTDPTSKIEYFSTAGDASSEPSKKRPRTE